jgi:NAD(P)-dependent dehydrogenase (short-subunit alcohol dehydrogenase family)
VKFRDHVVLITGASSGIGAALARELAREGAKLVLLARRRERLDALCAELAAVGTPVVAHTGDVTQRTDLDAAVALAVASFGRLDMAVANAGFGVVGPIEKLGVEDYRRQFDTNVFGVLETIKSCLAELRKARGRLVLIGSVAGYVSMPNASPYSMSKFAIRALAEAIGPELRPHGVAVTLISPGFITSEIRQVDNRGVYHAVAKNPLPAWLVMPAEVAAKKIVSAAYRRRREAIITAHGRLFVGLRQFAPWVLRLAAARGLKSRAQPKS